MTEKNFPPLQFRAETMPVFSDRLQARKNGAPLRQSLLAPGNWNRERVKGHRHHHVETNRADELDHRLFTENCHPPLIVWLR